MFQSRYNIRCPYIPIILIKHFKRLNLESATHPAFRVTGFVSLALVFESYRLFLSRRIECSWEIKETDRHVRQTRRWSWRNSTIDWILGTFARKEQRALCAKLFADNEAIHTNCGEHKFADVSQSYLLTRECLRHATRAVFNWSNQIQVAERKFMG